MDLAEWRSLGGRYRIRIRETHVRDHLAPLLTSRADGAVKLDLVLRGLARSSGEGAPQGLVPEVIRWQQLHDLVREGDFYGADLVLKRKWVSDKLARLEQMGLIRRESVPGARPRIIVLRDDGTGEPFDDPQGKGSDSYVTVLGTLVAFGRLSRWGAPQVAAYLAAMVAERFARADPGFASVAELERVPLGGGLWYRPLSWFVDEESRRPASHVRIPFSTRTLKRGIHELKSEGLMWTKRIRQDPRTGRPFVEGPRVLYRNGFDYARPGRSRTRRPWPKFGPPIEMPSDILAPS